MSRRRVKIVARFRGRGPRRGPYVLASGLAHVAVVLGFVFLPALGSGRKPPPDFIPVMLAPGPPAAPARAVAPAPPAPTPTPPEPPDEARVETRVPKPTTRPKPKDTEPKPEPSAPQPQPPAPQPAQAAPAPGGPGGPPGGGADITSLDVEDLEFAWYRDRVSAALKTHWRQPILEGLRESLAVTLSFEILQDGSVVDPRIDGTSGVPSLDRSALRAVIESDPLPPLPPNWRKPSMSARFVFRWYP